MVMLHGRPIRPPIRLGDTARRFLYYYRVIEYASAFYLESTSRTALRIALSIPNALDDLSAVTETVVAAVQKMKLDDYQRYESMMREVVAPSLLWKELVRNEDAFTTVAEFEGGFKSSVLFTKGRTEESYTASDVSIFAKAIRDIRNALSHGRDSRQTTMITPTAHNFEKLEPWIGPIRMAATQVIVYKDVF